MTTKVRLTFADLSIYYMFIIVAFLILHWYLSLFFQSFFHHRYAAHAQYQMSKFGERLCFILSYITQGSNYLSPYGYGVMHSPKMDGNFFKMMWRTKVVYTSICNDHSKVEERFTKGVPRWDAFDRMARSWVSRIGWGAVYVMFYRYFVPEGMWYLYLLLPIHFFMSPIHGAIINWFAHLYGYRNFEVSDTSKNLLPVDVLMWGESYHNNHHKHGGSANFGGWRWHEIDPMYVAMRALHSVGLIKLNKLEPVIR
jgi:stearoyl-CoA desaturase (delta-9 desaturase)